MPDPHVFIIRPESEGEGLAQILDFANERARRANLVVKVFRSKLVTMYEEARERAVEFLEPNDAHGMYRLMHEAEVLILSGRKTYVRRDPRHDPPRRRAADEVADFVRYKGVFALVRSSRDIEDSLELFAGWRASNPSCSGLDDPRCLPLHVFKAGGDAAGLQSAAGRTQFNTTFGPPGSRRDLDGRRWIRGTPHGGPRLTVGRCELPAGVHWDVSGPRRTLLCVSNRVWKFETHGGYANVYPNAHVRLTNRSGCRKVWP